MPKKLDIKGMVFGRLTVLYALPSYTSKSGNKRTIWMCRCVCGKLVKAGTMNMKNRSHISCGCYRDEVGVPMKSHGKSETKLYAIWSSIKSRCQNKKSNNYDYYGGRGITVCIEWLDSFTSFYDWAMRNGYEENLEIDRINNSGNYDPSNCRWVTHKVNCNNRRPKRACKIYK